MTIDNTPAIKAFVSERMKYISATEDSQPESKARLDELNMVLTLCEGLERQNRMLEKALGL